MVEGKKLVAGALAAGAFALSGCGGQDSPAVGDLLGESMQAAQKQDSATFSMQLSAHAPSSDPQVSQFLGKPLTVSASGAGSRTAVQVSGEVSINGQPYKLGARADESRTFVQLLGSWYGPGDGLNETERGVADNRAQAKEAVEKLRVHGDQLLTGEVTEGPEIGGEDTWQLKASPNPDGIVKMAAQEGNPMTADEQSTLRAVAPLVKLTLVSERDSHLPRSYSMNLDLNKQQVQMLQSLERANGTAGESLNVDELHLQVKGGFAKWGEPVTAPAPQGELQPMDAASGALLGMLLSMAGSAGVTDGT